MYAQLEYVVFLHDNESSKKLNDGGPWLREEAQIPDPVMHLTPAKRITRGVIHFSPKPGFSQRLLGRLANAAHTCHAP